jgi:hypothetical protein
MTVLLRVAVKLLPVMTVVRLGSQYNIRLLIKIDAERCSIFFSFLFFPFLFCSDSCAPDHRREGNMIGAC